MGAACGAHPGSKAATGVTTRPEAATSVTTRPEAATSVTTRPGAAGATFRRVGAAPSLPTGAVDLGAAPGSTPLQLSVLLPPRNQDQLNALSQAIATPGSPQYQHFLTPSEWDQMFAPLQTTLDSVVAALGSRGLHPGTPPSNRMDIPVVTTVQGAETAFSVRIHQFRLPGGRVAYANLDPPSLPAGASGVEGLDDLSPPMPQ